MYKDFKRTWLRASKNSSLEDGFKKLFEMIEGEREVEKDAKIMVTQLTLHGIATYYYDRWHKRIRWSSPSTEVFNSPISNMLYKNFFEKRVLNERFFSNSRAKCLIVMGNGAFRKVKRSAKCLIKGADIKVQFKELQNNFSLKELIQCEGKLICKIKHATAKTSN